MKYQDNVVKFECGVPDFKLTGGAYTPHSFCISDGQDPDHNVKADDKKTFNANGEISFKIGRHGTKETAKWFKDRFKGSETTFNHDPDKLNFAFMGTLALQISHSILPGQQEGFTFQNIGLAQGSTGVNNNWWFAAQGGTHSDDNNITCNGIGDKGSTITVKFHRGAKVESPQTASTVAIFGITVGNIVNS